MAFALYVHDKVEGAAFANNPISSGLSGQNIEQSGLFPEWVEPGLGGVTADEVERFGEDVSWEEVGHGVALGAGAVSAAGTRPTTGTIVIFVLITAYGDLQSVVVSILF